MSASSSPDAVVPPEPVEAATVLLVRDDPAFQVLMMRRHHGLSFAAGALVFPGGRIHSDDSDAGWRDHALGWRAVADPDRRLRIAGMRELFEETGVLMADAAVGGAQGLLSDDLRRAVAAGERGFLEVVREAGLRLDLSRLVPFSRWIAPPAAPKRFDTYFYLAHAPAGCEPVCDGGEAVEVEWLAPQEALDLGARGQRQVMFPTRMNLRRLAASHGAAAAMAEAARTPVVPVHPQVVMRDGVKLILLPPEAGYGDIAEPFTL